MERPVPIFILSGFLGSGKTTLLSRAVRYWQEQGWKPAVVMNEIGEVNLDRIAAAVEVPMAEMLDGCICCTVRGDLGLTIQQLIRDEEPDVVLIEATGIANPMEILDGVTEASLYMKADTKGVITVVDSSMLRSQIEKGSGKTYRLLEEQVRCASVLILNKMDLVEPEELNRVEEALKQWNPHATLIRATRAEFDMRLLDQMAQSSEAHTGVPSIQGHKHHKSDHVQHECGHEHHESGHEHHESGHVHHDGCECGHAHEEHGVEEAVHHHSHDHVMVYTRYLQGPVDSTEFEALVGRLPESVYRAKGVLTFRDTASRYLFQYAYQQADFMKITPQGQIPDVVVFIGEHIPKEALEAELDKLEQ